MADVRRVFRVAVAAAALFGFVVSAMGGDGATDQARAWWKTARARMETVLARQGRTLRDLESPKWFEVPYYTVGRMPLIDTCLREPLTAPEVALWADDEAKAVAGSLERLLGLAETMASGTVPRHEGLMEVWPRTLELSPGLPEPVVRVFSWLLGCLEYAAAQRDAAFAALSPEERAAVAAGLPGYFVRPTPQGETIVGYTTDTGHCVALIDLLRKVDFARLAEAGTVLANAGDCAQQLKDLKVEGLGARIVFEADTPAGKVAIGGTGDGVYDEDYALFLDLGGNDVYRIHAACASLSGFGAAVHIDLAGNDVYQGGSFSQGAAVGGTALFMDLAGDDRYFAGRYSQGAALGGTALFFEGGGDDSYEGDFGAQCFALFGTSVFAERGGRDSYRVGSMGQACASTLGVAILAEGGGDDVYRAGGKHGFYGTTDAACAQGAASGMRMWPPSTGVTVYGGIGFLSDASGADTYHAAIIGMGGSYVFALGMCVDSEGNDVYAADRYCQGVGVHLSAGVAVDRAGDDVRTGFYGNFGYSLDRSSGVCLDLAGDDTYRTLGGIGFGHKPKGTGVFVDVAGKDTYSGTGLNYGLADIPFGDEMFSAGFFVDLGGKDLYAGGAQYKDDASWDEGSFGHGEDAEVAKPERDGAGCWAPETASDPQGQGVAARLTSPSARVRFTALDPSCGSLPEVLTNVGLVAAHSSAGVRRHLLDVVQMALVRQLAEPSALSPLALLAAADPDLRLLGLQVVREGKIAGPVLTAKVAALAAQDPSDEVRGMACLALSAGGGEGALAPVLAALGDDEWRVRRRAAIALSELKDPASLAAALAALREDPAFQVRGFAARTLGRLGAAEAVPALEKALSDGSEFVRALAAEALLLGFSRADAMDVLIATLDWPNGVLRERWVLSTLADLTGQSLPMERAVWAKWWAEAKAGFDLPAAAAVHALLSDARKRRDERKEDEALALYREIRKSMPRHAGACKDLGEILNSRAWQMAVAGTDLPAALELAREAADATPTSQVLDTFAVLLHLNGQAAEAEAVLTKAAEGASEADRAQYERRLAEIRSGRVQLQ